MCGIYGFIADLEDPAGALRGMQGALLHRGPDHQEYLLDGRLGLGHNRLAILDLTSAGHQPMTLTEAGLTLVFNGEIFNYRELKRGLGEHVYSSQSDSEVLLRAYQKWGSDCLTRLNGMFAFAVWDHRRESLFLARDRFGIKPLVYAETPRGFFFASEPKALFSAGIPKQPDLETWATYLKYGTYDHSDRTFFEGVRQLRPGHFLTVNLSANVSAGCYYDFPELVSGSRAVESEETVQQEYGSLMRDAVDLCFRSDVPVGIAASGGVDSSALIAMASKTAQTQEQVQAFTFTCDHPKYDETPWVKETLQLTNHPWHVSRVFSHQIPDLIESVSMSQEEPFGGFSTLCLAELCDLAGGVGVTVLLDGNGLDEQWAGYEYYGRIGVDSEEYQSGPVQGSTTSPVRPTCLTNEITQAARNPDLPKPFRSDLDNLRFRDLFHTKIPRALRFSDRASMMHSRELRVPFLDHRLVEYSFKIAPSLLIRNGQHKYLLRKIVADLLPEPVVSAPKRPVQTPQREWLAGVLFPYVWDLVNSRRFRELGWFNLPEVECELLQFKGTEPDNSFFVWQWISAALLA